MEPNYPVVLANLATLANWRGEHEEAVKLLRQAAEWTPKVASTLNNLAYQLALLGQDLPEAESLARRAVAIDPDQNNRDTLGLVLVRVGRWKEADAILSTIVRENPQAFESVLHLGMAKARGGRTQEARDAFRTVVERSENASLVQQARDELQKL